MMDLLYCHLLSFAVELDSLLTRSDEFFPRFSHEKFKIKKMFKHSRSITNRLVCARMATLAEQVQWIRYFGHEVRTIVLGVYNSHNITTTNQQ